VIISFPEIASISIGNIPDSTETKRNYGNDTYNHKNPIALIQSPINHQYETHMWSPQEQKHDLRHCIFTNLLGLFFFGLGELNVIDNCAENEARLFKSDPRYSSSAQLIRMSYVMSSVLQILSYGKRIYVVDCHVTETTESASSRL